MKPPPSGSNVTAAAPHAVDQENPWPGLAAFEEGDREFFNGREDEIAALLRLIVREDLILLWGFSGLGKTSLLRAGLFPRLREADIFPVHVRLHYDTRSVVADGKDASPAPPSSLWEQCFDATQRAAERWQYEIPSREGVGSVWEYVRRRNDRFWGPGDRLVTPLLVFDQFEELFTHDQATAQSGDVIARFFRDVSDAIAGCPPAWLLDKGSEEQTDEHSDYLYRPGVFKVLLSFREDYLAHVANFGSLVRAIDHNYYRLESMTFKQGLAVVAGGGHLIDQSSPEERDSVCIRIVEKVSAAPTPAAQTSATVDPALLSLFCRELNENRRQQHSPVIDRALVESAGASQIISGFYEASMRQVSEAARRFVEERLVLRDSRTRESLAEETAFESGLTRGELDFLIEKRILRREETTRRGQPRLELTHDVLVEPAVAARVRREAEEQRQQEERNRREQVHRERAAEDRRREARELALIQERDAAERRRLEREVEVQAQRADDKAILARRRTRYIAALLVVAAVAIVMAVTASLMTVTAVQLSHAQDVRLLIQAARIHLGHDPQVSTLFSSRATEEARSRTDQTLSLAAVALNQSVRTASHVVSSFDSNASSPVLSPDGSRLALIRDDGRVVEVRDGSAFTHIAATIEADNGKQIFAAYFLRRNAALIVVNSDGALDRIDLSTATGVKTHLAEPTAGHGDDRSAASAPSSVRRIEKWAFNPERGRLLVSSFIPIDYAAMAAAPAAGGAAARPLVKRWVSVADADGADGSVWLSDIPLDSSALSEVVLAPNGERYALVNQDGQTTLMDGNSVVATHTFDRGSTVRISGDGSYVLGIPPSVGPLNERASPSVTVWTVRENVTRTLTLPGRDEILTTVFSPDGRFLAVVQAPGIAQVWDLRRFPSMFAAPIVARGVAFSPDSRELLSWDESEVQVWSLTSVGRQLRLGHQDEIVGAAIARKPGAIVTSSGSQVKVWSRSAFDAVIETAADNGLGAVALSPDGRSVAAGGRNRRLIIADVAKGAIVNSVETPGDVVSLAYSADGSAVAAGLRSGVIVIHALNALDSTDRRLEDRRGPITAVTFARADSVIAYAVQNDDQGLAVLKDLKSGATIMEEKIAGQIVALTVSADGGRLAVGLFKPPSYEQGADTEPRLSFQAFSTNARAAAAPPSLPSAPLSDDRPAEPNSVFAPDPDGMEPAALAGNAGGVTAAAGISSDLRFAVTSSFDRRITPWFDAGKPGQQPWGMVREQSLAFEDQARVLAVAPDGRHFAAGGERGLTNLYTSDRPFTEPVTLQENGPTVVALAFSSRGDQLASASADGTVTVYSFGVDTLLERARSIIAGRTLTSAECGSLGEGCSTQVPVWRLFLRQMFQSLGTKRVAE